VKGITSVSSSKKTGADKRAMVGDWSTTADFFGAILAGLLLGLLADALLNTTPWLVILGVLAGFGVGFQKMYEFSKQIEDQAREAQRERDGL
jgi:F0F1-type ATP synthase assembly protein I